MSTKETRNDANQQARAQLDSIVEYYKAAQYVEEHGEFDPEYPDELAEFTEIAGEAPPEVEGDIIGDADQIRERAEESALSVEYRSGWELSPEFPPHGNGAEPAEMRIVLCTGGPHVEIRAEADGTRAELKAQGWFIPLENAPLIADDDRNFRVRSTEADERREAMEWYAGLFAFPE